MHRPPVVVGNLLEYNAMFNFMKTFRQYIDEQGNDDPKEWKRHRTLRQREQERHNRIMDIGGKEGEEAEKIHHRTAKKAEQHRHVGHEHSKYKPIGGRSHYARNVRQHFQKFQKTRRR